MNLVPSIALAAAAVGLHAAFIWYRLGEAPGWRHHRWFAVASLAASAYAACGFVMNVGVPFSVVPWLSSLQLSCAMASVWAWLRYTDDFTGRPAGPLLRWVRRTYVALAVPGLLLPGLLFRVGDSMPHVVLPGRIEYQDIEMRPLGAVLTAVALLGIFPLLVRFAGAWRRGVPLAGLHTASIALLLPVAVSDALTATGLIVAPYLLEVAFVVPIAVVASAGTYRFVAEAREHERLRRDLEREVGDRTRQLGRAQSALHEAERLAALGQFASGIAHEVNNPAAAVTVNLRFIQDSADPGPNRVEVRQAAVEGLQAMDRILGLVRRLAEAGRLAGRAQQGATCELADALVRAVEDVAARWPDGRVAFRVAPLSSHRVAAPEADVQHAVHALLVNAGEAVPGDRAGHVEVSVAAAGAQVEIRVEDDGVGLAPEVMTRAFEPFFSTKPPGRGPGLGLTLARAFARRHGGDVRLERGPRGGALAILTLQAAAGERAA